MVSYAAMLITFSMPVIVDYLEHIMVNLRKRFMAGKVEEGNFNYIGFKVDQEKSTIALDQSNYVTNIQNITTDPKRTRDKQSTLTSEEQTNY